MGFWLLTGTLTILVLCLFLIALLRTPAEAEGEPSDVQVYRDQLGSLEKDVARGIIVKGEAERTRIEISRRILEADQAHRLAHPANSAPRGPTLVFAGLIALTLIGGSFVLYRSLGAPGYADMPMKARLAASEILRAERPTQAAAEAGLTSQRPNVAPEHLALLAKLRDALSQRPDDLRGLTLLAINEAAIGNYTAAHLAQAQTIALRGEAATAEDYSRYADFLIVATGGYVSPRAELALTEALRRNPGDQTARYYSGLMFGQINRPDLAFRMWRSLLEDSAPDAPWSIAIQSQIQDLARLAGVNYTPPAVEDLPDPDAEAIAAASDLNEEDRDAMVRSMVSRLADRLADQGGSVQEWGRLISAYGVLGEIEKATAIWQDAQTVFAARPDDLAFLKTAADSAGVRQ